MGRERDRENPKEDQSGEDLSLSILFSVWFHYMDRGMEVWEGSEHRESKLREQDPRTTAC